MCVCVILILYAHKTNELNDDDNNDDDDDDDDDVTCMSLAPTSCILRLFPRHCFILVAKQPASASVDVINDQRDGRTNRRTFPSTVRSDGWRLAFI